VCGTKVAPVKALLQIAEAASTHPTHGFLSTHFVGEGVRDAVLILLWATYLFIVFN